MDDRPASLDRARHHLRAALDAEEPAEKDYHLRNALQMCECDGRAGERRTVRPGEPSAGESDDSSDPVSGAVVRAVAAEAGERPVDLPEPLYDVLDPDALNALFGDRPATEGSVTFRYCGYGVTVTADDTVVLEEL